MQQRIGSWSADDRLATRQHREFCKARTFCFIHLIIGMAHHGDTRPNLVVWISFQRRRDLRVEAPRELNLLG